MRRYLMHIIQSFKIVVHAALLICLCALFVEQVSAEDTDATITPGVLTIGSDLTYPPYLYLDEGKAVGSDPEFMRMIADHLGLEPDIVDTRFAELIVGLRAKRFDVVASNLYITPERAEVIDYVPYYETGDSIMVLADSDFTPRTPRDLCGKSVSNIKGASWIPKLDKVTEEYCLPHDKGEIEIHEYPTAPEATQALLSRAVDVQFADALIAKLAVEKSDGNLRITSEELLYPIPVGL